MDLSHIDYGVCSNSKDGRISVLCKRHDADPDEEEVLTYEDRVDVEEACAAQGLRLCEIGDGDDGITWECVLLGTQMIAGIPQELTISQISLQDVRAKLDAAGLTYDRDYEADWQRGM